ncbi:uncharacterized protein L201_005925 [Kwoniella dendrophila CBS 6074]|uniref:Cytoplasmic protein n=1 Tax=Kwoniella dendrophila CBS 6074 TaxID=1295534 RepID=A0AAX4JZS6_9TREE
MLKDIVERPTKAPDAPSAPSLSTTGFPVAVHRSQRPSAFARARQQQSNRQNGAIGQHEKVVGEGKAVDIVPTLGTSLPKSARDVEEAKRLSEMEEVRKSVESENIRRVEEMSNLERREEIEELKERFGSGIMDLMRKRKEAREGIQPIVIEQSEAGSDNIHILENNDSGPSSKPLNMSAAHTILDQVSEENKQRVESMGNLEREQEVEDLQERFGGKLMEALKRRAEARAKEVKGKGKGKEQEEVVEKVTLIPKSSAPTTKSLKPIPRPQDDDPSLSELKEFFPSVPTESTKLEWLKPVSTVNNETSSSSLPRFDLSGNLLSLNEQNNLPVHLGLHHHGDSPSLAGYTLEEILYLSRSTLPSQKITMMSLLTKIISKFRNNQYPADKAKQVEDDLVKNKTLKQSIDLGIDILAGLSRGIGVIESGIELLFESLNGPSWLSWINQDDSEIQPIRFTLDENEDISVASIPFEDVLPRLKELLSIEDGLSFQTIQQIILILRRATLISRELCETICPIIPSVIKAHVISRTWPPSSSKSPSQYPSLEALKLLRDITTSSRECAEDLLGQGIYETTLRFIVTTTWENGIDANSEITYHGQSLALEVLKMYTVLGRYGLSSNIVTSSPDIWRVLGKWVKQTSQEGAISVVEKKLIEGYFKLLEIWITCAIDPHKTTPEHDITWAQITAMKWDDEAMLAVKQSKGNKDGLAAALEMLCAWMKGIKVNGVRGGEEERTNLISALKDSKLDEHVSELVYRGTRVDGQERLLAAAVQLHRLLSPSGDLLQAEIVRQLKDGYLIESRPATRPETYLRYELLSASITTPLTSEWIHQAFELFQSFHIGDEPIALELLDLILKSDSSSILPEIKQLKFSDGLQILRPLLQYTILPEVEQIVGPIQSNQLYLKSTFTLRPPVSATSKDKAESKPVSAGLLPLQEDWIFSPLNELLRSGTSIAFQQLPNDWQFSEVEIIQSNLLLSKLKYQNKNKKLDKFEKSRTHFNLMKIHMLEHNQNLSQSSLNPNEVEVFRDSMIARLMRDLMDLLVSNSHNHNDDMSKDIEITPLHNQQQGLLETISIPFLGSGVPFYQFYQDFLDLYESISFSDKLFTQLLLPVLSMNYSKDYRKLFWIDHNSILKNIRITLKQVPCLTGQNGLKEYFKPYENDSEILTHYLKSLFMQVITRERNEFLWLVAVNHLSGLFWAPISSTIMPDEKQDTPNLTSDSGPTGLKEKSSTEKTRIELLIILLSRGSHELVKSILEFNLDNPTNGPDIPISVEQREERRQIVGRLTGEKGMKRIEEL